MVLSRSARQSTLAALAAHVAAACCVVAAGLALPASATEAPAGRAAAAKAPAKAGAPVPSGAPVSVPPGKDPLDHLRERLADKLGGEVKPRPTRSAPVVVKVVNKTEAEHAAAAARPAPSARPVPRPPAEPADALEPAPRLAALHREAPAQAAPGAPLASMPAPAGAPSAPSHDAPHWAYQGEGGPQAWAQLRAEFALCANGRRQSPIDIRDGLKLQLDPVQFNYGPSEVSVIDTGHTVQVNVAAGNSIEVRGRRYELQQFHFHRPSEERIDGRQFDMVAHLVHKDDEGRLAVVAVLLTRGAAQPLIQTVWNNLPLEKGEAQPVRVPMDLNALLPAERQYYTYMGSLTTPPCTEGVLWMVMKTPVQVSPEQIGVFSRLYPMNARPIQALGGRVIQESN